MDDAYRALTLFVGRIGINATGDTSLAIFGQLGTKYLISRQSLSNFCSRMLNSTSVNLLGGMNTTWSFD